MAKEKQSNFEFLKVIAMLMIVCHHMITQNAYNIDAQLIGLDSSRVFLQIIGNHAFIGNNLLFMVSAWFLCAHTETIQIKSSISRIWRLEKVMLFYSIGIPIIFWCANGGACLRINDLFPLSLGLWWYPTAYAVFLFFYPFYQSALQNLRQSDVKKLIWTMVVLWTIPTIIPVKLQLGAGNTTCFFMLYAIIFYVRKFSPSWASNKKKLALGCLGGYILAFSSILLLDILGNYSKSLNYYACYYIRGDWRILPVVISLFLFLLIAHTEVKYHRVINWMGGLTFAVYLIHMHPLVIDLLFKKIFVLEPYIGSLSLFPFVVSVTVFVFMMCIIIEQMRKWLCLLFKVVFERENY